MSLEGIRLEARVPEPDALLSLWITLKNHGHRPVTAFRLQVEAGGHLLPVYDNQLFMDVVLPGESHELPLFNLWGADEGRPAPKDGRLTVTVTLQEAHWVTIRRDEKGHESWTLEETVNPLPKARSTTYAGGE